MGAGLRTKRELQVLLMQRDQLLTSLRKLEEKRAAREITKIDYDILRERYESKLKRVERELGITKRKPRPSRLAKLKFWRKRPKKGSR